MSNDTTDDVDVRHRFSNDVLALVLVVSLVGLLTAALLSSSNVPPLLWKTYALAVALAAVWAFGKGALKSLLGALQGGDTS